MNDNDDLRPVGLFLALSILAWVVIAAIAYHLL